MLRRSLAVALVLTLATPLLAGSYVGVVTSVSDTAVVIRVRKDPSDKKSDFTEVKKLKLAKDAGFFIGPKEKGEEPTKVSRSDAGKAVDEAVEKARQKGHFAKVETNDKDEVTRVILLGRSSK